MADLVLLVVAAAAFILGCVAGFLGGITYKVFIDDFCFGKKKQ